MMTRKGDWMQTFGGRQFWPLDPLPEEVFIEDVAHALSMLCRFGGHCLRFYSVAEHSVLVSRLVPQRLALVGLLHDATEAYVADVPRPLKKSLVGYADIEKAVWAAVSERFGLPAEIPAEVKDADNALLLAEAKYLMATPKVSWKVPGEAADVMPLRLGPASAEQLFLSRYKELVFIQNEEK